MYAMQYQITLPADYDMDIIRHRVASRGHLLDDFPGLGLKAYGVRERGVDGSPVNQYAPFYLWNTLAGMNAFLWGAGFQGIINDFGRPSVRHWTGVAFEHGAAHGSLPQTATLRTETLPAWSDPAPALAAAHDELRDRAALSTVHSAALAIDPRHWELVHFTLWTGDAPPGSGERWQVLHLSTPELATLPTGRL
ncbi:protein of unknown function [Amycolatopsis xylanica]|uniref:DUF4865 domain-containing protein n=1 Tax=Amycolatopsis xylanica TaxID=589385 RepID=A0A1H2V9P3_9PSEU|nr:DUF4865 family protein [Amycolatopsis xylanica]SDW65068.1 protein of unknown function [Amycolatopsis xylanica]